MRTTPDIDQRRAMAAGYALALKHCGHDLPVRAGGDPILEFSDWFAAQITWNLHEAYRQWRGLVGRAVAEVPSPRTEYDTNWTAPTSLET